MGTGNGGYLDRLVISYIIQSTGYDVLQDVPDEQRKAAFLARLSREQQSSYIEDTLRVTLFESIPGGYVYVVLPDDCFKYEKTSGNVIYRRAQSSNGKSPPLYALEEIEKEIGASGGAAVLFYNQRTKEWFEQAMRKKHPRLFAGTAELAAPGHGSVALYTYSDDKPIHCPISNP